MADTQGFPNSVLADATGNTPKVGDDLVVENRTIGSLDQAFSVCETLVNDWKKGILNSARITSKLNGERPYNQKRLDNAGKGWKTNISTGFLATECRKIVPRLFMPLKTAKYLTAASLPADYPDGAAKSAHFRQTITDAVRSWSKFNYYIRGLAREVATFGFGFNVWFDMIEWRPTLMRMDKGFVPQGTEIMEEPAFFMAKYDYKPEILLQLLRDSIDAGRTEWNKDNVVLALNSAIPPPVDATYPNARSYEDLMRQATWAYSYTKGAKVVRTFHLFAKETTGRVSHYVLVAETGGVPVSSSGQGTSSGQQRLLYENLDEFESMEQAVQTTVFDFGDGTVHGSWGAGQILYDLAAQVEKIRCDSMDNMRLNNKIKCQVPDAKNVNDVKLTVNDQMVIVSGAQFAGNTAAMTTDVQSYEQLDAKLTQISQQKIGAYVPPIPLQPSDIKASQINAAMMQEKELQEEILENWLIQWAMVIKAIQKRLCDPDNPDEVAQKTLSTLRQKLTDEEIQMHVEQNPVKSVMDYTEYKAQNRAVFARSVFGNPLYKQGELARVMAEGTGDEVFVTSILVPDGDNSEQIAAQRQQLIENSAMLSTGEGIPVVNTDNDWVHMQALKQPLSQALMNPGVKVPVAQAALQHYAAHYAQGVAKKKIPDDQINPEKSFIAEAQKLLQQHAATQQQQQQQQQLQAAVAEHQQAQYANRLGPPAQ